MSGLPDMLSMVSDMLPDEVGKVPSGSGSDAYSSLRSVRNFSRTSSRKRPGPSDEHTTMLTLDFARGIVVGIVNNEV
jgi:hypothetical protein